MEKGLEKGAVWLIPLVVIGGFLAATFGMVAFSKSQASKEVLLRLESLVQKDVVYLDKDKVIGASSDYGVYTSIRTSEGEYALGKLISAELENDQPKGLLTIRMPNGELISGDFKSFLPTVLLRDGRKTQGEIIDKAVAVFRLKDGRFIPIKIVNGKIEKGRLTGVFSGRTLDTGFQIAAEIKNRKISYGYLLATPTYIPSASRTLAYLATVETSLGYEPVSFLGGADVLAATTTGDVAPTIARSFEGKTLFPNYDAGTYKVMGEEGAAVSLSTITEIVRGVITPTADLVPLTRAGALAPGVVTSSIIKDLTITNDDIALETIDGSRIKDGGIESADIKDSAITSAKIANNSITSDDIYDNTITTADISATLTFSAGDFIDLSAITHSTSAQQGLLLPNVSSASPTSPSIGEGYIAWDTSGNQVLVYDGSSWTQIGGSISLYTGSGETTTTSSASGLELINTDELSLLRGCGANQLLKWDETNKLWQCASDNTGAGGASLDSLTAAVANSTTQDSNAFTLNWNWDFTSAMVDTGLNISESTASTLGTQDKQALVEITTLTGSTASPLQITNASTDVGDVFIDLTNAGDFEIRDAGTAFVTFDDTGGTTITGNITANDAGADTILIGQSGTTDDTVTIAGVISLTDDHWSIDSTGAATGLSGTLTGITAGDLSCTNCIGATEIDESTISSTGLSDGANIAHINAAETISGGWTFNTAATTFTTAIDVNSASTIAGLTVDGNGNLSVSNGTLSVAKTAAGAGDIANVSGTSSNAIQGLTLALTSTADAGVDAYQGLNITWTESTDADTFTALNIGNTTTTNSTTTAISIGTGWDTGITVGSGGVTISVGALAVNSDSITSDGTLTIDSSGTVQLGTDDDFLPQLGAGDADIGATGTRWDNVYGTTGNFTNLTVNSVADPYVDETGDTMTGALAIDPTTTGTFLDFVLETQWTAGDLINADWGSAVTQTAALVGLNLDFTNLTSVAGSTTYGILINDLAAQTTSTEYAIYQEGTNWDFGLYIDDVAQFNSDVNFTLAGTEDFAITHDLAGTINIVSITGTPNASANSAQGIYINQLDSANANGFDAAIAINNADITGAVITDAILVTNSGGSGYTNFLNTPSIDISGAGAITGATGVSSTTGTFSGALAANGGITFDQTSDTIGSFTAGGTILMNANILQDIGNTGTDFIATTGALTLAGDLTLSNNTLVCTACIDITDIGADAVDDSELVNALTYTGALTLTPGTTTDFVVNLDADSVITFTQTIAAATDPSSDALTFTLSPGGTGSTGVLRGFVISQSDTATTGVYDSLAYIVNLKTPETTTNGLLIEQNAASGTLTNAVHVLGTAGAITDAIHIEDGAGTIADGIQFTGTFTNLINSTNFIVTNAGAVTLASVTVGGDTINEFVGNVALAMSGNALIVDAVTTGTTATTSSNSGLEIGTDGLRLLGGCTSGTTDILKWNGTNWVCSADATGGGGGTLDAAYNAGTATIIVDAYDVIWQLNDATNDYKFIIDNTTTGAVATAFSITTTGIGGTIGTAIDVSDSGIATGISLGASNLAITTGTIGSGGATVIDFAEFDVSGTDGSITINDGGNAGQVSVEGSILDIDSLTFVGTGTIASTTTGLTLDSGSGAVVVATGDALQTAIAGNPGTPADGMIWYDSTAGKYKVREGTQIKELCNKTDAACGAGSGSAWSALGVPITNLSLAMDQDTTSFDWISLGALNPWTFALANNSSTATTQNLVTLKNSAVGTFTDLNTETLLLLDNADTSGTSSTIVNDAIKVTVSGGIADGVIDAIDASDVNITNAINIGANAIAGTNFSVTGAGAVTAVGVTSSGAIAANAGITFDQTSDTIGSFTAGGTIFMNANILQDIGNTGTDFIASTGALTLAGTLTLSNNTLTCTACIDVTDIGADAVDDSELVNALTYTGALTLTPGTTTDFAINLDADSTTTFTQTLTTDATSDALTLTLSPGGTGSTGVLRGFVISQSDTATTGVYDTLAYIVNLKTPETTANGLLIEMNAASAILTNGIQVLSTAGNIASGILIADGAGTITDGITLTGTFTTNLLNTPTLDITGAGNITGVAASITGAGALTLTPAAASALTLGTTGGGNTTSITLATDGTGNAEIVLPNDAIGPSEVFVTGQTDEFCLTYEATGTTWEWQACGGGSQTPWTSDIDADNFKLLDFGLNLTSRAATTIGSADNGAGASGLVTLNTGTGTTATGGLTLITGNASAGTAGNVSIDVGTSTSGSGTISIGTANSGTITIGRSTQGITLPGFTGNNAVLYATTSTGVLAQATTSTSGLCLLSGAATGYIPTWTTCPGGGSLTVRETDTSPSVSSVTTLEFGPTGDSTADFVVTDQTGGVARIVLGSNVAHINTAETVSGGWTFNTAATTFTTAINANGGINSAAATNISFTPGTTGDVVINVDADTLLSLIGGSDGTDALNIAAGNLTLADGDLVVSGGDANFTLDAADTLNVTKTAANAGDVVNISGTSVNAIQGLTLALTSTADAGVDAYQGLNITWTESTDADTFTALNISNTTTTNSTTTAISIGTGWDTGISLGANSIDGTNFDVNTAGNITVAVAEGLDTNAAGTLELGVTTANAVTISRTGITTTVAGALTVSETLTLSNNTLTCTGCIDITDIGADAVDDSELVNALTYTGALTLTPGTTTDFVFNGDQDSNFQLTNILTSDATSVNSLDFSTVINAAAGAAIVYGVNINQADNTTNTAVVDAIARIQNANAAETTANGLLIEQTGAGTLSSAIKILETAGAITTGITIGNNVGTGISLGTGLTTGISIGSGGIAVDGGSITSSQATLVINAGGTVDIQDALSIGGALSGVTTLSSSGDWTWTATTPSITINDGEIMTIADAATPDTFTINTTGSLFSFSDGTNSYTFDIDREYRSCLYRNC